MLAELTLSSEQTQVRLHDSKELLGKARLELKEALYVLQAVEGEKEGLAAQLRDRDHSIR
jgi:hypothetical protein